MLLSVPPAGAGTRHGMGARSEAPTGSGCLWGAQRQFCCCSARTRRVAVDKHNDHHTSHQLGAAAGPHRQRNLIAYSDQARVLECLRWPAVLLHPRLHRCLPSRRLCRSDAAVGSLTLPSDTGAWLADANTTAAITRLAQALGWRRGLRVQTLCTFGGTIWRRRTHRSSVAACTRAPWDPACLALSGSVCGRPCATCPPTKPSAIHVAVAVDCAAYFGSILKLPPHAVSWRVTGPRRPGNR